MNTITLPIKPTAIHSKLLIDMQDNFIRAIKRLIVLHRKNEGIIDNAYSSLSGIELPSVLKNRATYEAYKLYEKDPDTKVNTDTNMVVYSRQHYTISKHLDYISIPVCIDGKCKRIKLKVNLKGKIGSRTGSLKIEQDNEDSWLLHLATD